jgi:spermidine synthase
MRLRDRLWNPYIVVFISSACTMIIELVASRLIAPRLGVSLYTWTSVIGVILAGMSLGNYIGGRLADRYASRAFLGGVFGLGAIGTLSILYLNSVVYTWAWAMRLPLMVWVVGYIAIVFFLPAMILGCVSPLVVKLSLTDLKRSGSTVGKIYAWSTVGSIVGTFAAGFYLISAFGTKNIVLYVATVLFLMAIWFLSDTASWKRAGVSVLLCALLFRGAEWGFSRHCATCSECVRETNYFCINVYDKKIEGTEKVLKELVLDRLVHSYSDLDDPTRLTYGYEKIYAQVIQPLTDRKPDLAAFFIGGGGYTFPRYMEAQWPQSHITVAEIDPGVTEIAYDMLGLKRDTRITIYNRDARLQLLQGEKPQSYDLVFGDAFNDYSVPYHLTTREFDQMVHDQLRPGGQYVINIIDGGQRGHFFRAYVRTLQQVFQYVVVIPSGNAWRETARTTFVVVASDQPADLSALTVDTPLTPEALAEYMNLDKPLVLTDDYVPVDNLLAPVFADSHRS